MTVTSLRHLLRMVFTTSLVAVLRELNILPPAVICTNKVCGDLVFRTLPRSRTCLGVEAPCYLCRKRFSLSKHSFFENSKIEGNDMLVFIYYFLKNKSQYRFLKEECTIRDRTDISERLKVLRSVMKDPNFRDFAKIGVSV